MSAQESTIEMYRSIAKNYDFIVKLFGLIGLKTEEYRKLTVDALNLSKGDTVVELGCGTGSNFDLLEDAVGPDGKIIGVDITDEMLNEAKKRIKEKGWNNIELVLGDITEYKIPKDVDGIIAYGALTYTPDYDVIIKNGYDALKFDKKFAVLDTKKSKKVAKIFTDWILLLTEPRGVGKDNVQNHRERWKRHPWKSIENYFEENYFKDAYGGFVFLSVGTKRKNKD